MGVPHNFIPEETVRAFLPIIKGHLAHGISIEESCNRSGIHRSTIRSRINSEEYEELKLIRRQSFISIAYDKEAVAKIIEFYVNNNDLPMAEIARKFNTSPNTVSRAVQKYFPVMGVEIETITLQSKLNEESVQQQELPRPEITTPQS